jgi:hypothetical protein
MKYCFWIILIATGCQNKARMKLNEHKIDLNVFYRKSLSDAPVLKKEQGNKDDLQPSKIDVDDPAQQFPQTYLELYGTGKQLIARFASENGLRHDSFFLLHPGNASINEAELTDILITENKILWKLRPGSISVSGAGNASEKTFTLTGMKIIPAGDDAVWVAGLGTAWLLDKELQNVKTYPWHGGIHSVAAGGRLCAISKSKDTIIFLDRHGNQASTALNTTAGFFEELIAYDNGNYLTLEGTTFRIYSPQKLLLEIPLQSLGLLDDGNIFYSFTKNKTTWLISSGSTLQFQLPANYSNYILPVVGQASGSYIGYHLGMMGEFSNKDQSLVSLKRINEEQYRELVYPIRWKTAQRNFYSVIDPFHFIVSVTGPAEVALIEIKLNEIE